LKTIHITTNFKFGALTQLLAIGIEVMYTVILGSPCKASASASGLAVVLKGDSERCDNKSQKYKIREPGRHSEVGHAGIDLGGC